MLIKINFLKLFVEVIFIKMNLTIMLGVNLNKSNIKILVRIKEISRTVIAPW